MQINNIETYSSDELLTLDELSRYLKLANETIISLIEKNDIPAINIDGEWKFIKPLIDDWLLSKMSYQKLNYKDIKSWSNTKSPEILLNVTTFFDKEYIITGLKPGNKEEVLHQLVKPLAENRLIVSEDFHVLKLMEREKISSTAIGQGIAIPHLKNIKENPKNSPNLIFGICKEGTDFDALDGKLTYLFFLLCTKNEQVHLKIMSKISSIFINETTRDAIINAKDKDEIIEILNKSDMPR